MITIFVFLLAIQAFAQFNVESAYAQAVADQQLFSVAIKKNLEYAERIKKTENFCSSTTEQSKLSGLGRKKTDSTKKSKRLVSLSMDCNLYESISTDVGTLSTVDAIGREYCFELQKKSDESTWRLKRYAISDDPDLDMQKLGFPVSMRRPSKKDLTAMFMPYMYAAQPYQGLVKVEKQPGFQLESAKESDGSAVLKFVFLSDSFVNDYRVNRTVTVPVSTELTLDAKNYYLPIKLVQVSEFNGQTWRLESSVDREFKDGLVVREQHHEKITISQTDYVSEKQKTVEYDYSPIPESEFLLTAYGFPEPTELAKKPWKIPANVWQLLVGVVLIAVAVFFKVRANQAR